MKQVKINIERNVSMQLSASLAEAGKKTLLIDADLRKSVMMGRTHTAGQEIFGLTHYLAGQVTLQDVIHVTDVKNFHLIYSGPFPPNPAELLGGKNGRADCG